MLALGQLGKASTREIAQHLPDVATATLYRHIQALFQEGVLETAGENKINGITEKIYRLAENLPQEAEATPPEDMLGILGPFLMSLYGDFAAYFAGNPEAPAKETGFRYMLFHLSPDEFQSFVQELHELTAKYESLPPGPGRKSWRFSTLTCPIDMDGAKSIK